MDEALAGAVSRLVALGREPSPQEVSGALLGYLRVSGSLTRHDPDVVEYVQGVLSGVVGAWAGRFSRVYAGRDLSGVGRPGSWVVDKGVLSAAEGWWVDRVERLVKETSGSTGRPFRYAVCADSFVELERVRHYGAVLEEFGLPDARVVRVVDGPAPAGAVPFSYGGVTLWYRDGVEDRLERLLSSHGGDGPFWVVSVDWGVAPVQTLQCLGRFVGSVAASVVLADGGFFALLSAFVRGGGRWPRVSLLSCTGDGAGEGTLEGLVEDGVADAFCDHMRCWDGGLGFMTCLYGTAHLSEELSRAFVTPSGKLAVVDFFNLAAPFVNYVGGDSGSIGPEWQRCGCGRWFRPFALQRRSRLVRNQAGELLDADDLVAGLERLLDVRVGLRAQAKPPPPPPVPPPPPPVPPPVTYTCSDGHFGPCFFVYTDPDNFCECVPAVPGSAVSWATCQDQLNLAVRGGCVKKT